MYYFGGNTIYLNSNDLQLSRGESMADTAKTLSLYLDCLVARVYLHDEIVALSMNSKIPVINGLSNLHHPCQILADLMTIREHKNRLKDLTLAWIGDGNNVCNDLLIACSKLGIDTKAAIPKGFEPPPDILKIVQIQASNTNSKFEIVRDPRNAVQNADIIVTDTFISIGDEKDEVSKRSTFYPKYQVNSRLMALSKKNSIFMHCLPAKRGQEVTSEVIDGDSSVIWNQAENRLHVQKSILLYLLG
jgi:ornithine carbamoyltransferase